ncbi:MAG: hypothetical protein LBH11_03335 [Propionibacteriaceae bacterium]|jgi:hypothetical protein|nr:hypothetical protein [Propionibacteriaceae bacterium]
MNDQRELVLELMADAWRGLDNGNRMDVIYDIFEGDYTLAIEALMGSTTAAASPVYAEAKALLDALQIAA